MLSTDGYIIGISSLILFGIGIGLSIFLFFQYYKHKAKILFYFAIMIFFGYWTWSFSFALDFLTILITGNNFPFGAVFWSTTYLYDLLAVWMWIPFTFIFASFIGAELYIYKPVNRKILVISMILISILYEVFLFTNSTEYLIIVFPTNPGEAIITGDWKLGSPPFIIFLIFTLYFLGFHGVWGFIKAFQAKGEVRKKLLLTSIGFFLIPVSMIIEGVSDGLIIVSRVNLVTGIFLITFGLLPRNLLKKREKKSPSLEMQQLGSYMLGKLEKEKVIKDESLESLLPCQEILIFISYATKDVDSFRIHEIANQLEKFEDTENVLYWEEDMKDNIFEYMDENIKKCDVMILFCSENSIDSVPVKKEWTAAEATGLPIIPVFYDVKHIPTLLTSRLGVEYDFYDMERNIRELRHLILKKVCTK